MPPVLHLSGVVLPDGEPRDLWVADGVLRLDPVAGAQTVVNGGYLLPGLVDAHCHVGLGAHGAVDRAETLAQAHADRDAGTLLIRDAGSPVDTRWLDGEPDAPRLIRAGRHLARPKRYLPTVGVEVDPADLPAAVEEQAAYGDGWVKLVGDWIDRDLGDLAPLWPAPTLVAAIDRAHAAGVRVTAHTFSTEAVPDLLAAGIDCLEHGTGLTDDQIAEMGRRGTALVPTLINVDTFPAIADRASRFPAYADRMRRLHATARDVVRTAYEAGVRVYVGTDAGGGIEHGRVADEIAALAGAGLPPDVAVAAGSWAAREWLGRPGLVDGAPADVAAYAADPRTDPAVLRHPVRLVLRGRVVR